MKIKRILRISLLVLGVTFVGTSCTSTEKGVLVGGALGAAAAGAAIGDSRDRRYYGNRGNYYGDNRGGYYNGNRGNYYGPSRGGYYDRGRGGYYGPPRRNWGY